MKLRTKIQLSFSITMAILLIIVGVVATQGSSNAIGILTNDSMANSATAEESAASTPVLSEQAVNLKEIIRNFKI